MPISKALLKKIRSLQQSKFRTAERAFVIEGKKSVDEAIQSGWKVLHCFTTDPQSASSKMELISDLEMNQISGMSSPSPFLAVMEIPELSLDERVSKCLYLDGVRDPGNLGTIIRSADWLGWKNIVLSNDCVEIWNPKVIQSTMGSVFKVNIAIDQTQDFLGNKRAQGVHIYGADLNGISIKSAMPEYPLVMVMGSEAHGIRTAASQCIDHRITIPSAGDAESLNVAIAASIIMFQWS